MTLTGLLPTEGWGDLPGAGRKRGGALRPREGTSVPSAERGQSGTEYSATVHRIITNLLRTKSDSKIIIETFFQKEKTLH